MATTNSPLTKADLNQLSKAAYELNQALLELEKAEQAGLDMSEERLRIQHQRERIEALLRVYANQSPTNQ